MLDNPHDLAAMRAEQVRFYETNGYLAGIRLLTDEQVEVLRAELAELIEPVNRNNQLFYEYHANESTDPEKTLFHALLEGVPAIPAGTRIQGQFFPLLFDPDAML